ncbi:MAG: tetratricopeptide repeat protein [Brevinematales bacterium]|nr:tetratricopeptide repeat protein [Brevinematales bacterium]
MGDGFKLGDIAFLFWIALGIGVVAIIIILVFKFLKKDNAMLSVEKLIKAGNYKKALALAQQHQQTNPKDYVVKYYIAQAYEGMHQYDQATEYYEKASVAASSSGNNDLKPQIYLKVGQLYKRKRMQKEALGYFLLVLDKVPTHSKALYEAAGILYDMKNFQKAKTYLETLVRIKPDNLKGKFLLGETHYQLNEYTECVNQLEPIFRKFPQDDASYKDMVFCLADALTNMKRYDTAADVLMPLLDNKMLFDDVLLKVVTVLIRENNLKRLTDILNRYINVVAPSIKVVLLYETAGLLFKDGEYFRALYLWRDAAAIDRNFQDLPDIMRKYKVLLDNPKLENIYAKNVSQFQEYAGRFLRLRSASQIIKQESYWIIKHADISHVMHKVPYPLNPMDLEGISKDLKSEVIANLGINVYSLFGMSPECESHYMFRKIKLFQGADFLKLLV